jgi:Fic-DOC domain mobile mystery protein B
MSDSLLALGDGQTQLSHEELAGLKLSYITTRGELNAAEQANILKATALRRVPNKDDLLNEEYLKRLHREMFDDVWVWAGRYRVTDTNIGEPADRIREAVPQLLEDVRYWIEHATFETREVGVRFHHALVRIHPFSNGNGRHSRIATDYLMRGVELSAFTWGRHLELDPATVRREYLSALRKMDVDRDDVGALLDFASN